MNIVEKAKSIKILRNKLKEKNGDEDLAVAYLKRDISFTQYSVVISGKRNASNLVYQSFYRGIVKAYYSGKIKIV